MIKNNPLITVYITNYNYEAFIQQSIESVLNQTYQDFELFIIDDGSTDNSKEIIEYYRDNEKVTIIYQQNKGLNITNNVAMRASNGKYLMRLDADDFLEPQALDKMSTVLENDLELGLVFPDYFYIDLDGNKTGQEKRHNFNKEVSLYDQPAHGACTMIRLAFLKKLGGYNESFTCQDGYDLWIKFITHYKVTNINEPLFSYRRHGKNLTGNEFRILSTRQQIKETFVKQHFNTPQTLAVIPVRISLINGTNWIINDLNGESILSQKIEVCIQSNKIDQVVVTSSDNEILQYCHKRYSKNTKVVVLARPQQFEDLNKSLASTIDFAIEYVEQGLSWVQSIITVSLEYPFLKTETIDEAINTLVIFNADSVITVRPDTNLYYQHSGSGMNPILNQNNFTKLEREALYKAAGGVMLTRIEQFRDIRKSISGNIAHVIVDEKTAFKVDSIFSYELYKSLHKKKSNK
jgi:CMP-N-acetylneuraminic acid synthetase